MKDIHFVDKKMQVNQGWGQVMVHFHLTPTLMFQYAPHLMTGYFKLL